MTAHKVQANCTKNSFASETSADTVIVINNNSTNNNKKTSLIPVDFGYKTNGKYFEASFNPSSSASSEDDFYNNNQPDVKLSDIIGGFGLFQLLVLLFSGLREGIVGYDAVVLSIVTQPETKFLCADNFAHLDNFVNQVTDSELFFELIAKTNNVSQCYVSDLQSGNETLRNYNDDSNKNLDNSLINCHSFIFEPNKPSNNVSLVTRWSLVCNKGWLVAFIESAYFLGLVTGNLFWGYYADKVGRRKAYIVSHIMSLVFGFAAVFSPSVEIFIVFRLLAGFGSIGYNTIYTIQVEIIGTEHRSYSTILNHLGWGVGVLMVPVAAHTLHRFEYILSVAPVLVLLMTPWAFWLPESSRWLMTNNSTGYRGESEKAKEEIIRAAKINGKTVDATTKQKISLLNQIILRDTVRQASQTNKKSYQLLFTSWSLVKDLLILSYITMLSHLFYYGLTINFSYIGSVSMEANFIISGSGEWIGCFIGALLMKDLSRRTCIFIFQIATALSFAFQAIIDLNLFPVLNTPEFNTINNGIGTVSSLSTIFVVLIVNQEVFPTVIRQTGSSIVNTLGESGSTLAPLLTQLCLLIGPASVNFLSSIFCLTGAFCIFFVTETSSMELIDTVDNQGRLSAFDASVNHSGRHNSIIGMQMSYEKAKRLRKDKKKSPFLSGLKCLGDGSRLSVDSVEGDIQIISDALNRADARILNDQHKKSSYGSTN